MNPAMEQWKKLAVRFEALVMRERVMVLAAVVVGTAFLFDTIAIRPLEVRMKRFAL